jgi:hypothetical protein
MQPITVHLQESKALASICSMSNRFYEVGWDMEHLLNVISEILSAIVVVLLHGPSSIRMSFLQWVLIRSTLTSTQLSRYNDKKKSSQTTKPRKTVEREATRPRKNNYTERMQKEERLSPLGGCPILGPKNKSGDLLSTSLSLSLASTSWVDRVDLYGLNRNGIGLSSS